MPTWTGDAKQGYKHTNGALLVKRGGRWFLTTTDGAVTLLPRGATFDHAEAVMSGRV